jgi:hypothetical protein
MTKGDQPMLALATGSFKFELNAPALGQATQLARHVVARHARWMANDQSGVKNLSAAGKDQPRD